jgi:hypothetical protein
MYNDTLSIELYKKAYALYLQREFSQAKEIFSELTQRYTKDKASLRLLESCIEYLQTPPPADWSGISIFTTK